MGEMIVYIGPSYRPIFNPFSHRIPVKVIRGGRTVFRKSYKIEDEDIRLGRENKIRELIHGLNEKGIYPTMASVKEYSQ